MKNCGKSKLKSVCEISAGQSAPQGNDKYSENGIPFIRAGNLEALTLRGNEDLCQKVSQAVAKEHKLKLYPKGTILFAKSGMSTRKGYVHVLKENAYVVSHLACIIPTDKIEPDFLKYYFLYNKPNRLVRDDSYPSISLLDISNITIPLPTLADQILIINIFKKIEKQIFNKKLQLEKLEQLAKSRFLEMFGNVKSSKKISHFVDSNIVSAKKAYDENTTIKYIDISSVDNKSFSIETITEYCFKDAPSRAQQCVISGDILVSTVRPNLKNIAVVESTDKNLVASSGFCVLRAVKCPKEFLFGIISSDDFTNAMVGLTTGANYPAIKDSDILKYPVPDTSSTNMEFYANFIQQLDKSKFRMKKSLKLLSYIRHL